MNPKYCCEVEPAEVPDMVEVIRCPKCHYKNNCINTTNGIDPEGYCKWGKKEGNNNG